MDEAWPFHELLRGRPANALRHVSLTLAKLLLDRGKVDPNLYHNGITPIMAHTCIALYAASHYDWYHDMNLPVMDLLIEHGADINLPDQLPLATAGRPLGRFLRGLTPLHLLCTNPTAHHPALQRCTQIEERVYRLEDVLKRYRGGGGRVNTLMNRFINDYKADINALSTESDSSSTALHILVDRRRSLDTSGAIPVHPENKYPMLSILLSRSKASMTSRLDCNIKNSNGETPMFVAMLSGHFGAAREMFKAGFALAAAAEDEEEEADDDDDNGGMAIDVSILSDEPPSTVSTSSTHEDISSATAGGEGRFVGLSPLHGLVQHFVSCLASTATTTKQTNLATETGEATKSILEEIFDFCLKTNTAQNNNHKSSHPSVLAPFFYATRRSNGNTPFMDALAIVGSSCSSSNAAHAVAIAIATEILRAEVKATKTASPPMSSPLTKRDVIDGRCAQGCAAFTRVVEIGSLPLLKLLLAHGATVGGEEVITKAEMCRVALATARQYTYSYEHSKRCAAYSETNSKAASLNAATISGSLLHFAVVTASHRQGAVGRGIRACVEFIVESMFRAATKAPTTMVADINDFDINALDSQGMPAVFYAAASGDANTLMRLLDIGADPIDIEEEKYAKSGDSFTNEIQTILYCEDDEEWGQLWELYVGGDDDEHANDDDDDDHDAERDDRRPHFPKKK